VTSIGTMTFGYDLNGNMTSRNGATIGWTSYNLPDHITHTNGDYADFTYGPDRSRWVQEAKEGTWESTRHYAGAGFEVLTWGTNSRVDTHYFFAGGAGGCPVHDVERRVGPAAVPASGSSGERGRD